MPTKIEWARETYNPWWGCEKISPACANCYAADWAKRWKHDIWGKDKPRRFFGDKHWDEPLKWNKIAEKTGEPFRVFCASMADVCEDREDLLEPRARLMRLIEKTPALTWMLLTKRPENFMRFFNRRWYRGWPKNVWAGTTLENQDQDARLWHLCKVPSSVRFLSCEPLLGPVDIKPFMPKPMFHCAGCGQEKMRNYCAPCGTQDNTTTNWIQGIDWVIVGGESGPRPMHPDWARSLRDQCKKTGTPYLFKQWGTWFPVGDLGAAQKNPVDGDLLFPGPNYVFRNLGKKHSGRILDGNTHDGYPGIKESTHAN